MWPANALAVAPQLRVPWYRPAEQQLGRLARGARAILLPGRALRLHSSSSSLSDSVSCSSQSMKGWAASRTCERRETLTQVGQEGVIGIQWFLQPAAEGLGRLDNCTKRATRAPSGICRTDIRRVQGLPGAQVSTPRQRAGLVEATQVFPQQPQQCYSANCQSTHAVPPPWRRRRRAPPARCPRCPCGTCSEGRQMGR